MKFYHISNRHSSGSFKLNDLNSMTHATNDNVVVQPSELPPSLVVQRAHIAQAVKIKRLIIKWDIKMVRSVHLKI